MVWPYEEFHCLLFGNAPRQRLVAMAREVQMHWTKANNPTDLVSSHPPSFCIRAVSDA